MDSQTRDESQGPKPRRAKTIPRSYSESSSNPPTPPKVKKQRAPAQETEEKLFPTKYQAILAERKVKGQVQFLVNWADDPETGEVYAPTWEPRESVLGAGRKQWAKQRREGLVVTRGGQLVLQDHVESQRPAKRRREILDSSQERGQSWRGPSKKPRQTGFLSSSVPETRVKSKEVVREVKDTYEDDTSIPSILPQSNIEVLVQAPPGFERDQYQIIDVSSQSSQDYTQPVSQDKKDEYSQDESTVEESEEEDSPQPERKTLVSQSQFIIPDSQDQNDSESYNLAASGQVSDPISDPASYPVGISQNASSSLDNIDSEVEEEPLYEIDCTYRNLSNPSLEATQSTNPNSNPNSNSQQLNSQISSGKSLSQLLTPVRETRHSQDSLLSSPTQSTGPALHESLPVSQLSHGPSQLPSPDNHSFNRHQLSLCDSVHSPENPPSRALSASPSSQNFDLAPQNTSQQHNSPQNQSFLQFSAPSQIFDSQTHLAYTQNDSLPIPESIQSTLKSSDHLLQSIEDSDEDEPPLRQVSSSYEYSLSANMDEAAVKRNAMRAARLRESEQKLLASHDRAMPNHALTSPSIPPSSITPSPLPALTQQQVHIPDAAEEQTEERVEERAPEEQHVIDEFAVREGTIEENQRFDNGRFESYTDVSPTRLDDPLQVQANSDNQYFVPLPLTANTREVYLTELHASRNQRNEFIDEEVLDPELVTKIDEVFSQLELLCSHPDLIIGDLTQGMDTINAQAVFAETSSTKCIFVAELLDSMRDLNKQVAILVRPGRMLDILDSILTYHKYTLQPGSRTEYSCAESGYLKVSLIPTGPREEPSAPTADLVVAFDSTFTDEPYLKAMRVNPVTKNLCPLVHLVVAYSIEHFDKVFSRDSENIERKVKICVSLSEYIDDVGKLSGEYPSPTHAVELISDVVAMGSDSWPLLPLPPIDDPNMESNTQVDTESLRQTTSVRASYATPMPPSFQQNSKRPFEGGDDVMDVGTPKRQRLTPLPDEHEGSSGGDRNPGEVSMLEKSLILGERLLLEDIAELRAKLSENQESEAQIRRLNENLQNQIKDLTLSIGVIQPQYQTALNDRGEFEHQAKQAIARATKLKENLDSRSEEVAKLKEQKQALEAELSTTRAALASSSIPEVAELENLRAEVRALKLDKERLEKNKISSEKQLDYMRENYQIASNAGHESATALSALQAELEIMRAKADDNRVQIHKIQHASDTRNFARMLKQLRIDKVEMTKELDKKNNELAHALNSRRSTRGVSAPMLSPRLAGGSPANGMSRGVNRVRDGVGARSRGTSPSQSGESSSRGFTPVGGVGMSGSRFQPSSTFGGELPGVQTGGQRRAEQQYRPR